MPETGNLQAGTLTATPLRPASEMSRAFADIAAGLKRANVAMLIGASDITSRYRRTALGQFWITLSNAVLILAIGFVWAHIWKMPVEKFLPYLAAGHIFWLLLTSTLTDASTCFVGATAYLKELTLPRSTYLFANLIKNIVIFLHNLVIVPLIMFWFGHNPGAALVWFFPAFFLVLAILIAASFWISLLGLRFRDVPSLLGSMVTVLFFLTPVIWQVETLTPELRPYLIYNPFFSLLELLRAPVLGEVAAGIHWLIAFALLAGNLILGLAAYVLYRRRITYWL
jgi:ABC-type polysaccharide/polyol phosphate export permease